MQWLDGLRRSDTGSLPDRLARAFSLDRPAAEALMRAAAAEFGWHLERHMLSRGGLAELVEVLGSGSRASYLSDENVFVDTAVEADGNAILARSVGSKDASRALAARIGRRSRLPPSLVRRALPYLAAVSMAGLALRAQAALGEIIAQVPELGRFSRGSPHADLAAILRRRCGAGKYSPRMLPRAVRRALARAGGFSNAGVIVWYARFMGGRPTAGLVRRIILRPAPPRPASLAPQR
jgi:hypothetical protein